SIWLWTKSRMTARPLRPEGLAGEPLPRWTRRTGEFFGFMALLLHASDPGRIDRPHPAFGTIALVRDRRHHPRPGARTRGASGSICPRGLQSVGRDLVECTGLRTLR